MFQGLGLKSKELLLAERESYLHLLWIKVCFAFSEDQGSWKIVSHKF